MEIRNATCSSRPARRVRAPSNGSHGLRVAFDPLASVAASMNLKAPAETGTLGSRINRSHRLVVVVVVVDGLSRADLEIYDTSNASSWPVIRAISHC